MKQSEIKFASGKGLGFPQIYRLLEQRRSRCGAALVNIWSTRPRKLLKTKCRRRDSNPHASRRHPLKMVCLPIPPLRRGLDLATSSQAWPAAALERSCPAVEPAAAVAFADSAVWRLHG